MSRRKCSTPYMMLLHRPRSTAVRRPCCIRRSTTACERCISLLLSLIWGLQALKYWQGWPWWTVSASICSPSIVTSLHSSWLAPWLTMWKGLQAACFLLPSHAFSFLNLSGRHNIQGATLANIPSRAVQLPFGNFVSWISLQNTSRLYWSTPMNLVAGTNIYYRSRRQLSLLIRLGIWCTGAVERTGLNWHSHCYVNSTC